MLHFYCFSSKHQRSAPQLPFSLNTLKRTLETLRVRVWEVECADNTCTWLKDLSILSLYVIPPWLFHLSAAQTHQGRINPSGWPRSIIHPGCFILGPFRHFLRHMFPRIFAQLKSIKLHFRLNELWRRLSQSPFPSVSPSLFFRPVFPSHFSVPLPLVWGSNRVRHFPKSFFKTTLGFFSTRPTTWV